MPHFQSFNTKVVTIKIHEYIRPVSMTPSGINVNVVNVPNITQYDVLSVCPSIQAEMTFDQAID